MTTQDNRLFPGIWRWLVIWLACALLALTTLAWWERTARTNAHLAESARLHATATQRVGQHDAHLTALSAVAAAAQGQRPDLFLEVAAGIMRFYPRIEAILLVPLVDPGSDTLFVGGGGEALEVLVRAAASEGKSTPVIAADPVEDGRYVMVKRSPNTDAAQYGLALVVDAGKLLQGGGAYWSGNRHERRLSLSDSTVVFGPARGGPDADYVRPLASGTQPLLLETWISPNPATLLPFGRAVLALIAVTLALVILALTLRQRAKVRAAERRAELSGHETQLSHAARVNSLGEMASGMAHELTQPLTAILAQSQAARHLAARGDADKVRAVLDEVIGQTKRASAILERLRTWTRPRNSTSERTDIRDCARHVEALLASQANAEGVGLKFELPSTALVVQVDQIEMEQVIFNLVRNALDAVAGTTGERRVTVSLGAEGGAAIIDVTDTGLGVAAEVRSRLFVPFVTTRDGGTGLGLALSQRLTERAGGDIALMDQPLGARFRVSLPLAPDLHEAAE